MIFRGFTNSAWFLLKCSLLAGLIGGVIYLPHLHRRVDEEIRRRVEARFVEHYTQHHPELQVSVRSAELVQGKGILVRGLTICESGVEGTAGELLRLEEIFLTCATEIEELLKGEPEVTLVVLRRPTLRLVRGLDGSWSAAKLLPIPSSSQRPPEIRVEEGTIEIVDPPRAPFVVRDFNGTLAAAAASAEADVATRAEARPRGLDTNVAEPSGRGPAASRPAEPPLREFSAHFVANMLHQVEISGALDPHRPKWSGHGSIQGLDISPELCEVLPADWGAKLAQLRSLRGKVEAGFQATYDPDAELPLQFHAEGHLSRARLDEPRLPHSLTDISADFSADNQGWEIRNAFARSGPSEIQLSCRRRGYEDKGPLRFMARVRNLDLDAKYVDLLPRVLQEQWQRYLPSGRIHADVDLSFDGSTWHPEATLQCLSVSFSYEKLPYRLDDSQGTIELKNDVLTAHLVGNGAMQPIQVDAEIHQPFSGAYGGLKAHGENIPLDEKLLAAMPEKTRSVIRSLAPQGTVNFSGELWRDSPGEPLHRRLDVALNNCAVRYEKFCYPIGNVRGRLEMRDDAWKFTELVGSNSAGLLACEGWLVPTPKGNHLWLRFTGAGVTLDDQLRDALGPAMRQAWNDFKPQGTFDLEEATLDYLPEQEKFDVALHVRLGSESVSITPASFPYRLENVRGLLSYHDGEVTLTDFSGEHGNARLSAAAKGTFQPDGSWRFQLDGLHAERLRIDRDRDLLQALPERLKKVVAELDPQGPLYLNGTLVLARGGRQGDPIAAEWVLELGFDQASVDVGVRLSNVFGTVRLIGGYDGAHLATRGELNIESLSYKDFQVRHVAGPVSIDDRQVLFGGWVDRVSPGQAPGERAAGYDHPADGARPRPITGQFAGGTVAVDGWVTLGAAPRFVLRATLAQGDLARLAHEVLPGHQNLQGDVSAKVEIHGTGRSLNLLGGYGNVQMHRAYVYDLPVMAALMKFVRMSAPDQNALAQSDVDFHIEGTHIYLDRITLSGDAMRLDGQGEMNFQGDIRLTFQAGLGRGTWNVPVLKQVVGGVSRQVLLVHVGGTLQNPEISKEPFPGLNQALQQLQGDRPEAPGPGFLSPLIQGPADFVRQLP